MSDSQTTTSTSTTATIGNSNGNNLVSTTAQTDSTMNDTTDDGGSGSSSNAASNTVNDVYSTEIVTNILTTVDSVVFESFCDSQLELSMTSDTAGNIVNILSNTVKLRELTAETSANASSNGKTTAAIAKQASQLLLTDIIPGESFLFDETDSVFKAQASKISWTQYNGYCGNEVTDISLSQQHVTNVSRNGDYFIDCLVIETSKNIFISYADSLSADNENWQSNFLLVEVEREFSTSNNSHISSCTNNYDLNVTNTPPTTTTTLAECQVITIGFNVSDTNINSYLNGSEYLYDDQYTNDISNISYIVPYCQYYNETLNEWADNGCYLLDIISNSQNESQVICACNHLTFFGLNIIDFVPTSDLWYQTETRDISFDELAQHPWGLLACTIWICSCILLLFMLHFCCHEQENVCVINHCGIHCQCRMCQVSTLDDKDKFYSLFIKHSNNDKKQDSSNNSFGARIKYGVREYNTNIDKKVVKKYFPDDLCDYIKFPFSKKIVNKGQFLQFVKNEGLVINDDADDCSKSDKDRTDGRYRYKYILKRINLSTNRRESILKFPMLYNEYVEILLKVEISEKDPWLLQEYINGHDYTTCIGCVNGKTLLNVCSVCCDYCVNYYNYSFINKNKLDKFLVNFVKEYDITGIICFDFRVDPTRNNNIYIFEANPRPHSAIVLMNNLNDENNENNGSIAGVIDAFINESIANGGIRSNNSCDHDIISDINDNSKQSKQLQGHAYGRHVFWLFHELLTLFRIRNMHPPTIVNKLFYKGYNNKKRLIYFDNNGFINFNIKNILVGRDAILTIYDPWPVFVSHCIHMPYLLFENIFKFKCNGWSTFDLCIVKLTTNKFVS